MTCSHCNRVAWYYVGREFFCGQHKAEAWAAANKEHVRSISQASVDRFAFDKRRIGRENPVTDGRE